MSAARELGHAADCRFVSASPASSVAGATESYTATKRRLRAKAPGNPLEAVTMANRLTRSWRPLLWPLIVMGLVHAAQAADGPVRPTDKPLLWMIDTQPPSYLYGTIHVPDERVLALPDIVERAFAASDVVCTEIPLDAGLVLRAQQQLMLPPDTSMRDLLPEALYTRLDRYLQAKGLNAAAFDRFKPWVLLSQLTMLDYMQRRASHESLDEMLWNRAKARRKQVAALETIDEQFAVFDSLTHAEQATLIGSTLDLLEKAEAEGRSYIEDMVRGYLTGDEERLQKMMTEYIDPDDAAHQKLLRVLVQERDVRMAERIVEKLKAAPDKAHFFAAGALHFGGPESIDAHLRKAGMKVRRLTPEDIDKLPRPRRERPQREQAPREPAGVTP